MKRFLAILTVLTLFSASMMSYAECLVSLSGVCPERGEEAVDACGRAETTACGAVGSCCFAEELCSEPAETDDAEQCGHRPECNPCSFYLLVSLIADGPIRATTPGTNSIHLHTISQLTYSCTAVTVESPDLPPPRAVHLSIASTVLRI
ncbi:hypothetical protein KQH82_07940 [bacterium]|nr:hypothetical protein [bacterium]